MNRITHVRKTETGDIREVKLSDGTEMYFNEPVEIVDGADCNHMFAGFSSFNQTIIIPVGTEDCSYMFLGCNKFNQKITIPNTAKNCSHMFDGC